MKFIDDIKSLTKEERLLLFVSMSLFLPFVISSICIGAFLIYKLVQKDLVDTIKKQPGALFLYGFCVLEVIVSLFYSNYIGALNACGIMMVGIYIAYYRRIVNSHLFDLILKSIIFLSIIFGIFGLFEFAYLSNLGGYSFFEFHIQNKPSRRIHLFFWNANLYAMMIEFFVASCLYQWVKVKALKTKVYYVLAGLFNLGMLYLTGCRAGFIPLAIIVPLFFVLYGNKKYIIIACSLLLAGLCLVYFVPSLIPRLSDISTIESRMKIWKGAIEGIKMYPLFGNGPQTYGHLYPIYGWHKAPHAHNIYLDAISSYGIIGTVVLAGYLVYVVREIWQIRKQRALFALIISFVVIVLVHGFVDCTLNIISTSVLFFMIINASCMRQLENINRGA